MSVLRQHRRPIARAGLLASQIEAQLSFGKGRES